MRLAPALLAALLLSPALPAAAQQTREGAETRLNRQLELDRLRDRANDARFQALPPGPPTTRSMEEDRRTLQPDVGRPEESGRIEMGGERGALSGGLNPQR